MGILRKNQKEILEIRNTVNEMKNAFEELISGIGTVEERISEFEDMSKETFKTEDETRCQSRFDARYWMLGACALGRPSGGMGREEGGGFRMGNTCIPVADSFLLYDKTNTIL